MKNRNEIIRKNIREYMTQKNLKQADLVRATGIKKANMSNYLSGKNMPGLLVLGKIATALNVPVSSLLYETNVSSPANKQLSSDQYKRIILESSHDHIAAKDFEWKGKAYKAGDPYEGDDIPILLYGGLIETTSSRYIGHINPPMNFEELRDQVNRQRQLIDKLKNHPLLVAFQNAPPEAQDAAVAALGVSAAEIESANDQLSKFQIEPKPKAP